MEGSILEQLSSAPIYWICGGIILRLGEELNAFAVGEENAGYVGVNVRRVKLTVLIAVSVLIGVCVSVSGSIAFVGDRKSTRLNSSH